MSLKLFRLAPGDVPRSWSALFAEDMEETAFCAFVTAVALI